MVGKMGGFGLFGVAFKGRLLNLTVIVASLVGGKPLGLISKERLNKSSI
ncbi:hypothetical protein BSPWISOXPB_8334 [uncultured Gammaproteobacteria bacterium]|nr:hypothetical protein BSPWISOXPB_8334 [uncultured Gammaproteobacteria bacterium]